MLGAGTGAAGFQAERSPVGFRSLDLGFLAQWPAENLPCFPFPTSGSWLGLSRRWGQPQQPHPHLRGLSPTKQVMRGGLLY